MTAAITEIELNGAISRLKANKSPGPDGFPSDWYKAFRTELLPSLLRACNTVLKDSKMGESSIALHRGSPQGVSPSPLYSSLSIEPLAQLLRQTESIKGVNIKGEDHKVALYADDILIYFSDPSNTFPDLMNLLQKFDSYSGYKLNVKNTQLSAFNYSPPTCLTDKFQLRWDNRSLKYLGTHLPNNVSRLAEMHYLDWIKIREDIKR